MDVTISELLSPDCIDLDLKSKKKREIIKEMVAILVKADKIQGAKSITEKVMAREKEIYTGIGKGVAIPHRLIRGLQTSIICFGRKTIAIDFDSHDKKPVDIFFLILGPEGRINTHLRLLCKLARCIQNNEFLKALRAAQTPQQVIDTFVQEETRQQYS